LSLKAKKHKLRRTTMNLSTNRIPTIKMIKSKMVLNSDSEYDDDTSKTYKPTKVSPLQQATSKHSASSHGPTSSTNPAKKPRQSPREPLHDHVHNVPCTPGPEDGEDHEEDMVVHHNYYQVQ
jgi:hypothetical protein